MKYIIAGTDRPDSNTLKVSKIIQGIYKELGEAVEIIDLKELKQHLHDDIHYGKPSEALQPYINKVLGSDGLIVVCPEYNGSMPGILKYFIDHLKFPESFEYRPVCFVGLGAMFGALRPVEHLQGVFGYRNAFIFPERVFMMNVFKIINAEGQLTDELMKSLLVKQAKGFQKFAEALKTYKLDANSFIESKKST
ncbi:NAD(P)H-dependent oxidoreductase [Bdellovibrio bacteriovorus]|uniref:Putative flavoprotein n=1 Tax=Bdellovibrio bacteriovorus (strain ATCC 15356 / DSM 50701 / NCIMB 9529 / HD100) TaxID=264462 RepID=Q6MLL1_BDEBA|nr:NAD(P)H-dependent oxidoreductase [Bdellovibrio bacteriovorus]CAE79846.1 putative flavoprotein [Bdellovibrio bacteriovorus HD100]